MTSHTWKFADDTSLLHPLSAAVDYSHNISPLQLDLDLAFNWSTTWAMEFGIAKCAVIHFGASNPNISYSLGGEQLHVSTEERLLGLIVADTLKPSLHCQKLASAAHAKLSVLFRCFGPIHKRPFLLIYRGLVRPSLEYACQAWSPGMRRDIDLLERVQRRATRMVSGLHGLPYEERLRFLGLQTLETRRHRADLILVYKLLHHLVDYDYRKLLTLSVSTHLRGHPLKLAKFQSRINIRLHSFPFRVVNPWNGLPASVVAAPSVNSFKHRLHASGVLGEL